MSEQGLNEAQRAAAAHGEGPMLVLAGPGSGKTFTITKRIFHLISQHHIPESQILVITFTRDAALSMRKRYQEQYGASPVCFGTFHSVFYNILKTSRERGREHILKDSDKRNLLIPLIKQQLKRLEPECPDIKRLETSRELIEISGQILSAFSYYKNTFAGEEAAGRLESPWRESFCALFRAYERRRRETGGLDFDDMVWDCLGLFRERPNVLERWRSQFRYFLIDEFQDINPVQYQVVRLLAAPEDNVFAVGDDDQSIYAFRGSDPSLMRKFLEDYPAAEQVLLNINYRSTAFIVDASLKVIGQNKNRFEKTLTAAVDVKPARSETPAAGAKTEAAPARTEALPARAEAAPARTEAAPAPAAGASEAPGLAAPSVPVSLGSFSDRESQYGYLAERLKREQAAGRLADCAVLFRTNALLQSAAVRLSGAGIPYRMKEKQTCIYDHFIAEDTAAYVRLALGELSRSLIVRIMNKPQRGLNREQLISERVDFRELAGRQRNPSAGIEKLERDLKRLGDMKPGLGMRFLRRGIGYEDYLLKKAEGSPEKKEEWLELLEWLTEDAARHESFADWLEAQRRFREEWESGGNRGEGGSGYPGAAGNGADRPGTGISAAFRQASVPAVNLMTAHASKGLEFPRVFLPDLNERVYPHGQMPQEAVVEEECRLLYVAMTRAKEALELLCISGQRERPGLPSRYLRPLAGSVYSFSPSTRSSNSQVSRYSSNASATFSYSSSSSMKSSFGSSLESSGFSEKR